MINIDKHAVQAVADLKAGYTLGHADVAILNELARIALASLEAEPVAYMYKDNLHADARFSLHTRFGNWSQEDINEYEITEIPLYTATPAPVSVPDAIHSQGEKSASDDYYALGWNACRAAMLQGAEPVTKANKLPDDFDFDRFNDVVWLEAVASNPHMHSPTTSTIAMVALELNKRLDAGNSPVIPDGLRLALSNSGIAAPESDEMLAATCEKYFQELVTWVKDRKPFRSAAIPDGWVAVPVEPTIAILDEFDSIIDYGAEDSKDAWSRLLAAAWIKSLPAAPQREVK
ncbi:TPA: hypothetical protein ACTY1O_001282 [Enterobacter hormaechei]|uniref:hypothetical protein n=1 Tax=Enterobacter hormaechei TaxID=158836 RepID=UPI00330FA1F9|nr:hypothetical protein [Enterobacter hormaechei]